MAVERISGDFRHIDPARLDAWRDIPVAVAGDSLNRQQVMAARIKPVASGMQLCGQAYTINAFEGDNGAIHAALAVIPENVVLVIDAGGFENRALWGGILNTVAMRRKVAGVVIDGAVRDSDELREHGLPVFAAAISPAGPSKGWGGTLNGTVSCGNVAVQPGDIILGDADGVVAIPLDREQQAHAIASERLAIEKDALARVAKGEDTAVIFGAPPIIDIDT